MFRKLSASIGLKNAHQRQIIYLSTSNRRLAMTRDNVAQPAAYNTHNANN